MSRAAAAALIAMAWCAACAAAAPTVTVVTAEQPPYASDEGGQAHGIFIEVMNEVGQRAGVAFDYRFLPWSRAQQIARRPGGALIMPLARSPEREPHYRWIAPVLSFDTVLFTRDAPAPSLAQARALMIGIMFNTTFEKEVAAAGLEHVERVPDEFTNAKKLHARRIAGWITTDLVAPGVYAQAGFDPAELRRGPKLGPTKVLYLAASPDLAPELAQRLAAAIATLKRDGRLDEIVARYR
jgi:ABC-type amino acid transport substrate-binding protein